MKGPKLLIALGMRKLMKFVKKREEFIKKLKEFVKKQKEIIKMLKEFIKKQKETITKLKGTKLKEVIRKKLEEL